MTSGRSSVGSRAEAFQEAGFDGLRWLAANGLHAPVGWWWPETASVESLPNDRLYDGTAGILVAFAHGRLDGFRETDPAAEGAADRLAALCAVPPAPEAGLYVGSTGRASALRIWADATGSDLAAPTALAWRLACDSWQPEQGWDGVTDIIGGDAGALLSLLAYAGPEHHETLQRIASRLAGLGIPADGGLDWQMMASYPAVMPGFSHGTAGVGYALGRAVEVLGHDELVPTVIAAGRRMVQLGDRGDGTWLAPTSIPPSSRPHAPTHSYGWCHGPTGSLRLFAELRRLQPDEDWGHWLGAARRAVRESGLPERTQPGFWDNQGQCCGTAGVGEMALDAFVDTGDEQWLIWATKLGEDLLARANSDEHGRYWTNTEHQADPPELPAAPGWSQGVAGIAAFLLRLSRTHRDGPSARTLRLPDAL